MGWLAPGPKKLALQVRFPAIMTFHLKKLNI